MGGVKAMARKETAEFIACKLLWGCSRWAGRRENPGDSPNFTFSSEVPRLTVPVRGKTGFVTGLRNATRHGREGGVTNPATRGFETASAVREFCWSRLVCGERPRWHPYIWR
jgi:hypothetical protein